MIRTVGSPLRLFLLSTLRVALFFLLLGEGIPALLQAQEGSPRDTIVRAGQRYGASGLHRLFFGGEYRDLWTSSIRVPILDVRAVAGGLTPTTAGGGFQTKSLRFRGNNGQLYGFRSVDKDPDVLPPALAGTVVERLVQDQISSAHPAGPAIATPLMNAAGILHTSPQLVVLPDDPLLGEFRERFAGTLGFFEERAIAEQAEPFAGAMEIIGGSELFDRVQQSPGDRVDARAFLSARLFDILIGDWDRHRGQWGWARFTDTGTNRWVPIPEDRDQAFVRFDGMLLSLGRITNPQLVNFGRRLPNMLGLTWNGRELDRRFLVELERPVWDSVVTELQARLTDEAIDAAVAEMPREYRAIDGERMSAALKSRRDELGDGAVQFYHLLAHEVDIHGTNSGEAATVVRNVDGSVDVTLSTAHGGEGTFFQRRFLPNETAEIRVYLHGGNDRVVVSGDGSGIALRFIGGAGSDELIDSSRAGGVRFYSGDGDQATGPTTVNVDRRPFVLPPKRTPTELPPRDWGSLTRGVGWASSGPDVGIFLGGGAYRIRYGFRHIPYESKVRLRGGYSTGGRTGRVDLAAEIHRSNSRVLVEVGARASGIEVLRFFGLGNEIQLSGPNDDEFYRVNHTQYSLQPTLVVPLSQQIELSSGPNIQYSHTADTPGRYLATIPEPYGAGRFGQIGWRMRLQLDTRDVPGAATQGVTARLAGEIYPKLWDVDGTYVKASGEVTSYLSPRGAPFKPTLALRAGGQKLWGRYPFQDAAFIGDASSVRLGRQNRYAGDASIYGNAELRLQLGQMFLVLPGHFGIFGLGDVGRVFWDGESSDLWHNAVGGGVWVSFLGPGNTLSIAITRCEVGTNRDQRTSIYVKAGFAY